MFIKSSGIKPIRAIARLRKSEERAVEREERRQERLSFLKMKNFVESINTACFIIRNAERDPAGSKIPTPSAGMILPPGEMRTPIQIASDNASRLVEASQSDFLNGSIHPYTTIEGKEIRKDITEYFDALCQKWDRRHELVGALATGVSMALGLIFGHGGIIGKMQSAVYSFLAGFAFYWAYTLPVQKAIQTHYMKKEKEFQKNWALVRKWAGKKDGDESSGVSKPA